MRCNKCNKMMDGIICPNCGEWDSKYESESQKIPQRQNLESTFEHKQEGYYATSVKQLTKGLPFVLGCILITLTTIANIFSDLTWTSIIDIAFASVHIAGLWMLVIGSAMEDSVLAIKAMSLFRISAILSIVFLSIVLGIVTIYILSFTLGGFSFLIILGMLGFLGYIVIKLYLLALMKVLQAIRSRIERNVFEPLDGLGSFLVISYISICITIISAIFSAATGSHPISSPIIASMHAIGMILCLHALKRFA